ncbi:MAG TPA: hypothetical protein VHT24_01350 [Pseudacidobacterium sp.]|jgi:hypothetical protein|nr:hypothetical protein [Pseudacidobacterium sp.]
MNGIFRQWMPSCVLLAIACISGNSFAQISVTTSHGEDCANGTGCADQQVAVSTLGVSPLGPAQVGVIATGRVGFGLQEQVEVVKGQPYQAQAVTEMKQTLGDGSHIVQTNTATVARDSEGRTVRVQKLSAIGPWKSAAESSQESRPVLTSILDPVAKTHIDYMSDMKVAHVITMPPLPPGGSGAATMVSGFAMSTEVPTKAGMNVMYSVQDHADSSDADNTKTESLGTKSIEGVLVTGTRSTNTIPAGAIGNDKDIVVTRETWYSPDLKVVVQSVQNDPRFGQSTYTLTNIQRDEPDQTMFQVPAGYKIDKEPNVVVRTHPQ